MNKSIIPNKNGDYNADVTPSGQGPDSYHNENELEMSELPEYDLSVLKKLELEEIERREAELELEEIGRERAEYYRTNNGLDLDGCCIEADEDVFYDSDLLGPSLNTDELLPSEDPLDFTEFLVEGLYRGEELASRVGRKLAYTDYISNQGIDLNGYFVKQFTEPLFYPWECPWPTIEKTVEQLTHTQTSPLEERIALLENMIDTLFALGVNEEKILSVEKRTQELARDEQTQ